MRSLFRLTPLLLLPILVFIAASVVRSQEKKAPTADLKSLPISTDKGEIGYVLTQWWRAGTAAGNVGDFYDNRDGGHSNLDTSLFPQLQRIVYSAAEVQARLDWAVPRGVRSGVVFGNSSTSLTPVNGGSNPFQAEVNPGGLDLLQREYAGNNIYIFPEHNDYDPGHDGFDGGFGDVYPTNTPYLIISQGSSGSDQPFMAAVAHTLAAFRPEVKERLRDTGSLMPTVQMILRLTNKGLKDPRQYATGNAHPTVFEGSNVDEMAMIRLAHSITLDTLPPQVAIKVLQEDTSVHGVDFFEPGKTEHLADTSSVVARIWRGKEGKRRMRVSAAGSRDLNGRPLTYQWALLRGDPRRVKIEPNATGTEAEITVDYHERLPIRAGSAMESNRVDIGVFVNNGAWFSPPAFITFYSLDNEARAYDDKGRILEIGYDMTDSRFNVKDWAAFFTFLHEETPRRKLLSLDVKDAAILEVVAKEYARRAAERADAQKSLSGLGVELKADDPKLLQARKTLEKIDQDLKTLVDQPFRGAGRSALQIVVQSFSRLHDAEFEALLPHLPKTLQPERQRLIDLGIAVDVAGTLKKTLLREAGPTRYEKAQLDRFADGIVAEGLYPDFLRLEIRSNTVDPRLTTPRNWRDVYQYDGKGNYVGWTRYSGNGVFHFNRDGLMILKTDALGRCIEAQAVRYQAPLQLLQMIPTGEIVSCAF